MAHTCRACPPLTAGNSGFTQPERVGSFKAALVPRCHQRSGGRLGICASGRYPNDGQNRDGVMASKIEEKKIEETDEGTSMNKFPFKPISALASLGFLETTYLTTIKLAGVQIACPISGGCSSVLTSDYSNMWGVFPLSILGMIAYGAVAGLSIISITKFRSTDAPAINGKGIMEDPLRSAVLAGSLLLGSTSAYLLWILYRYFPGDICPWCLGSALINFSIVGFALSGLRPKERVDAIAPGCGLIAATFMFLSIGLGNPDASLATSGVITELPYRQPLIGEESPRGAVELARLLKNAGARMYGAFWCSHCYEQKQMFGRDAMEDFPYVECFPEGWKQGIEMASACQAVSDLKGFPTWVIGDRKLEGVQSFETLSEVLKETDSGR